MKSSIAAAVPNSVVLVMDYESGEPPESMGGAMVASTGTCVAIGTLSEQSGETSLTLSDNLADGNVEGMQVVFDGSVKSTSGELSLVSALNERLLTVPTASGSVRVRVFANHDQEPDRIAVVVG